MNKNIRRVIIGIITVCLCVGLIAAFAVTGLNELRNEAYIVGKDTFYQTIEQSDGSIVNCYASGDEYFNYLHDEEGYILVKDGGYVYYAKEKDGRPVASPVRYDADKEKIDGLNKMAYSDIDFEKNSDLITEYPKGASPVSDLINRDGVTVIANLVIYICFSDETPVDLSSDPYDPYLNGGGNSLRDYYYQMSYGSLVVENFNSYRTVVTEDGEVKVIAVYQDSRSRSYYSNATKSQRASREKVLLNSAVNSLKNGFELENVDLDVDDDGFVDAVNFLISGSPVSSWGGLMWPHAWDLNYLSDDNPAKINGIKVKDYSFNFIDQLTVGLLCHEFGHVLGCPDLYHYDDKKDFSSVGEWDLMHYENDVPQYMNVHLRDKYLGFVSSNQIVDLNYNGVYTLKPVTVASKTDVLAYRIATGREDEHIMVEYRNNAVTNYDSELPGSGLLVYRIKDGIDGNENAQYENSSLPDEVYVFRPNVATSGNIQIKSNTNLNYAYLSPNNPKFSSVGKASSSGYYDYESLYYTDGLNTKIVVSALSISNEEITFSVRMSGTDAVDDDYFDDKLTLGDVKLNNDSSFSGVFAGLSVAEGFDNTKLSDIIVKLSDADGNTVNTLSLNKNNFGRDLNNGQREFSARFIVNAKGNTFSGVFNGGVWQSDAEPVKLSLYVVDADNDFIELEEKNILPNGQTWERIQLTNAKPKPALAASGNATAVVRADGNLYISATSIQSYPVSNVIGVGAGSYHLLFITGDFRASSLGSNVYGEGDVGLWTNIIKVDGGEYTSYGLDLSGRVYALGSNDVGQRNVESWTDIIDIAAGRKHVVGLKSDGTVVAQGSDAAGQISGLSSWTNIVAVTAGDHFTAGLKSDGTVVYCGSIAPTRLSDNRTVASSLLVSSWTGVKKITAGADYLLALCEDGTVLSTGENSFGQCGTRGRSSYEIPYKDIVDFAAGESHSVFLREDGAVLFLGANNGTNNITQNLINYDNYTNPSSIEADADRIIVKVGGKYSLGYKILPYETTYKKVDFVSNNKNVVTVDEDGAIVGVAAGEAVVVISHRGFTNVTTQVNVTVIEGISTSPSVAAGDSHTLVLDQNGTVYAKGSNVSGQLDVYLWGNIVSIAAGGNTSLGVTADGTVKVAGELKNIGVEEWTDIVAVATDGKVIIGIKSDKSMVSAYSLRENENGRANLNLSEWQNITAVSVSETHTVGLTDTKEAVAKGEDKFHQLTVSSWKELVQVAAGNNFTLGLKEDGTVEYSGESLFFNIGEIAEWTDIIDLRAYKNAVAAVDSHGEIFTLGYFEDISNVVKDFTDTRMVAAGVYHLVSVNGEGEIFGGGKNNDGRLNFDGIGELPYIPVVNTSLEITVGVRQGAQTKINLRVTPYNATDRRTITYETLNSSLATVDDRGVVTGISTGITEITAKILLQNNEFLSRSCQVVVFNAVSAINWVSKPTKTVYSYGDPLDLSGGRISVVTPSGSFSANLNKSMIYDYENVTAATDYAYINPNDRTKRKVVVVLDEGAVTAEFDIVVKNKVKEISIYSLPTKINYLYGEEIDLTGIVLTLTHADGASSTISYSDLSDKLTDGTARLIGTTETFAETHITIVYVDSNFENNELSLTYSITVFDKIKRIIPNLTKYQYAYGENLKGGITVEMLSGLTEDIAFGEAGVAISGYGRFIMGEQRVTLSYDFVDDTEKPEEVLGTFVYTVETDVAVVDTVSSFVITSETFEETDKGTVLVYKTGSQINLTARIIFDGGAELNAPLTEGGVNYLRIRASENSMTGQGYGSTMITVEALSYRPGISGLSFMTLTPTEQGFNSTFATFGLANVTAMSIEGGSRFKYGTSTDLRIKITEESGVYYIKVDDTKMNLDNKILNTQIATVNYFGLIATKSVVFYNYTTSVFTQSPTAEIIASRKLQDYVTLYAEMADGSTVALDKESWSNNLNNSRLGMQVVTIKYLDREISTEFEYTFEVTVKDEVKEIIVLTAPYTRVQVYKNLDFSAFSIRITYNVSPAETVSYNTEKFTISGFKNDVIGTQRVTITYILTGDSWGYDVTVTNVIRKIEVDGSNSKSLYSIGEKLSVRLICVYATGETEEIDTYIDTFDSSVPTADGETLIVNFTYQDVYTTTFPVRIIAYPTSISVTKPTKEEYEYGEALNLDDGFVIIYAQGGKKYNVPLSSYASELKYNPTPSAAGRQTLTVSMAGRDNNNKEVTLSSSFSVRVKALGKSVLTPKEEGESVISVDFSNKEIYINENMTVKDVSLALSSYAKLVYRQSGKVISPTIDGATVRAGFNLKIAAIGANDVTLAEFTVFRRGDTDGDGLVDESDIEGIAKIIAGNNHSVKHTDFDGDGRTTLKDLVKWIEAVKENRRQEGGD